MQAATVKKMLAIAAVLVLLLGVAAGAFWYWTSLPLYKPGMVSASVNLGAPLTPPAQGQDPNRWIVEKDIQLHHFAVGAGENVLIVHGGPGRPSTEPWAGLDALKDRYRFIYYDQRGSGRSTRPIDKFGSASFFDNMTVLDRTLGIGAQLADIERIRTILGGGKLVLIGHSFGGFLASLYAAEFPRHVKALILVAPADLLLFPQEGKGFFAQIEERLPQPMRSEYADFLKRYLDYASIFAKSEAELVALNAELDRYYAAAAKVQGFAAPGGIEPISGGGWMVHAMYLSMGRRHDYRGALKRIDAPVIVIHGAKDLQPEQVSRGYADAIPGAGLAVLPNAGHFPFSDQPDAFAAAVGRFLGELRQ
jgi:proline iminopeptidase